MILRVAGGALAALVLILGGLIAYGYSITVTPQPVSEEIPDDQLPR